MMGIRMLAVLALLVGAIPAFAAVDEIYNYRQIDEGLSTSGQVQPENVASLAEAGFGLVVNLAVADEERNGREGFLITEAGLSYVQIPVVWDAPTLEDLDLFFAVMDARGDRRTLVHCFANYRASAFTYLYRTLRLGVPEAEARADFEFLWNEEAKAEYPQWVEFIEHARSRQGR